MVLDLFLVWRYWHVWMASSISDGVVGTIAPVEPPWDGRMYHFCCILYAIFPRGGWYSKDLCQSRNKTVTGIDGLEHPSNRVLNATAKIERSVWTCRGQDRRRNVV